MKIENILLGIFAIPLSFIFTFSLIGMIGYVMLLSPIFMLIISIDSGTINEIILSLLLCLSPLIIPFTDFMEKIYGHDFINKMLSIAVIEMIIIGLLGATINRLGILT